MDSIIIIEGVYKKVYTFFKYKNTLTSVHRVIVFLKFSFSSRHEILITHTTTYKYITFFFFNLMRKIINLSIIFIVFFLLFFSRCQSQKYLYQYLNITHIFVWHIMWSFGLLFCIHINHFGVSRNLKKRKKILKIKK